MIITFATGTYVASSLLLLALYFRANTQRIKNTNALVFVIFLFIILLFASISGLRDLDAGHDTEKYVRFYSILDKATVTNYINLLVNNGTGSRPEIGFWLYALILNKLGVNPQFFLLITSLISSLLFFIFFMKLKVGKSIALISFFIFLSSATYYILTGNYIRQAVAIPLFLLAYLNFCNKNTTSTILYFVTATICHYPSAPLFFLAFIFSNFKYKTLFGTFTFCCLVSATGLVINLISNKAFSLIDSNYFYHPSFLFFFIFEVFLFCRSKVVMQFSDTFHKIHKLAIFFFSLSVIFYFNANAFNRVAIIYFILFSFLVTYYFTFSKRSYGTKLTLLLISSSIYMFITFSSESLLSVLGYKNMFG